MKKIILLSVVATSFILGANVVNDLVVDQKSKTVDSTLSNGAYVSQGQTDIQDNSNVDNVNILQREGTDAGNLIENSTVNNTELYQGLTVVDSSRLENADLESKNSVKNVTTDNSVIGQGVLIVGGESNVTGTAGSGAGGGYGGIGGGSGSTGDNIEITQTNLLQDTDIKNSFVIQGLTRINNGADVSNTFKLNQTNTINRASASGINDVNSSHLIQGITKISGGTTTNIEQTIENVMEDITVDGSVIRQSSMKFTNSTISNINNNNGTNPDDKNRVTNTEVLNSSTVEQSSINARESTIDGLYKQETDGLSENNWIHTVTTDNSIIKQSTLDAVNSSNVNNVTYKKENMSNIYSAPNLVYNSNAVNSSNFLQDVSELVNGDITDTTFNRGNSINTVNANSSTLKQFNVTVTNSTLNSSNLRASSIIGGVNTTNANLSQGSTIITD